MAEKMYAVKVGNSHFVTDPLKGGPAVTTVLSAAMMTQTIGDASNLRRQADRLGFKKARVVEVEGGTDSALDA